MKKCMSKKEITKKKKLAKNRKNRRLADKEQADLMDKAAEVLALENTEDDLEILDVEDDLDTDTDTDMEDNAK
jgi:hypothetical protein